MSTKPVEHKCYENKEERDNYALWLEQNGYMAKKYYKPQHKRLTGDREKYCLMIVDMQAPKVKSQ